MADDKTSRQKSTLPEPTGDQPRWRCAGGDARSRLGSNAACVGRRAGRASLRCEAGRVVVGVRCRVGQCGHGGRAQLSRAGAVARPPDWSAEDDRAAARRRIARRATRRPWPCCPARRSTTSKSFACSAAARLGTCTWPANCRSTGWWPSRSRPIAAAKAARWPGSSISTSSKSFPKRSIRISTSGCSACSSCRASASTSSSACCTREERRARSREPGASRSPPAPSPQPPASDWTGAELLDDHRSLGFVADRARPLGPARSRSARQDGRRRGDRLVRRTAGRGARLRPSPRCAASRHQAGQHSGEPVRPADAGRLQHFVAAGRQRDERRRNVRRHVCLHVARAFGCVQSGRPDGPRSRHRAVGHVFARPCAAAVVGRPHRLSAIRSQSQNGRYAAGDGGRAPPRGAGVHSRGCRAAE